MVKTIVVLAAAGFALAPFTQRAQFDAPYGIDPIITSADGASTVSAFVVSSASGATCRLAVADISLPVTVVQPAPDCAAVAPGLEQAANWQAGADGVVHLTDETGRVLLDLGPSDGFAWESLGAATQPVVLSEAE